MTRPDRYVLRTVLIVALGGFLFGFDASVIAGVITFVEKEFSLGKIEMGWAVASLTLTATLSIMVAGPLADRYGRRRMLHAAAVVFTVSALMSASASDFTMLILARLLSGLGVGAALVVAPMYIAEISPAAVRGRMVSINQLHVVVGISAAFFSNWLILKIGHADLPMFTAMRFEEWNWRWMLGIGAVPSVIFFVLLFTVPESPRWLAMHGRLDVARSVLSRAHGEALAETELAEVRTSLAHEQGKTDVSPRELLAPELRRVVTIGLGVGILQQITGINAVFFYAPVIFEHAGASADAAFAQAVYVGLVNLVFTVIAMLLIDRLGRRPLLMMGTAGIALSMGLLAWGFRGASMEPALVLIGVLAFVASFAVSLGPIMWVLLSEIFPNRVRGVAISFVGLVNSTVSFGVQLVFPWELTRLGNSWPWLIYGAFALLGLLFIARLVPETRGRSLEELEEALVRRA
ncbi:MAG: transporter, sugar porter family [Steroidobacteraceae bacterium]|nr:transporter, sugar porter family [Steroidobacteraceae bacterium]